MHTQPHPLAGQTVVLRAGTTLPFHPDPADGAIEVRVEDWCDRVFGQSWMTLEGNAAALAYALRSASAGLPLDNAVVYGKDEATGFGHLVHVSEIVGGAE